MAIEVRYRITCDARGGLCGAHTKDHSEPNMAHYDALEMGFTTDDAGDWRCPEDHGKQLREARADR